MLNISKNEDYDTVRQIYTKAAYIACLPGFFLNILLLWIVIKRTPSMMMNYRNLLMAPCIIGMIIAFWTFIVQPIPIVFHGYHAVVQNGFFRHAEQPWNYTANTLWFQFLFIFLCITTLMFVYRYYMAFDNLSNGTIPNSLKFGATSVVIFLLCVHIGLHYWSDYPYDFYKSDMETLAKLVRQEVGLTNIRFSSFCFARSYPWMLHCLAMVVLFALCYAIIIFCFVKTNIYFRKTAEYNSEDLVKNQRLLKLHKQVTWALCIQAILPTINVTELILQTTVFPVLLPGVHTIDFMIYAAIPLYFIPLFNPFIIIFTVKPYWRTILSMIPFTRNSRIFSTTQATTYASHMQVSSFHIPLRGCEQLSNRANNSSVAK